MPHLSQLQRDYKDKNFTIIGMTSGDKSNTLEAVHAMVEDKGDTMGYTVAFDDERTTNEAWMKAAGRKGIPSSFLVDKSGKIAWIGHPANVDIPLAKVIDGTWDYVEGPALMKRISGARNAIYMAAREDPKKALQLFKDFHADYPASAKGMESLHFTILSAIPDRADAATRVGRKIIDKAENAGTLNAFAWPLVDPEVDRENRFLDLALLAAKKASKLTEDKDGAILDTLARVYYWTGDLEKAIEIQTRAVEHSEGKMKESLETVLAEYKKSIADRQNS